jgi:hypothetical protein
MLSLFCVVETEPDAAQKPEEIAVLSPEETEREEAPLDVTDAAQKPEEIVVEVAVLSPEESEKEEAPLDVTDAAQKPEEIVMEVAVLSPDESEREELQLDITDSSQKSEEFVMEIAVLSPEETQTDEAPLDISDANKIPEEIVEEIAFLSPEEESPRPEGELPVEVPSAPEEEKPEIEEEFIAPSEHKIVESPLDFSVLEDEDAEEAIPMPEGYVAEKPQPKEYELPDFSDFVQTAAVQREDVPDEASEELLVPSVHTIIQAPIVFPEDEEVLEDVVEEAIQPAKHKIVESPLDFSALDELDTEVEVEVEIPKPVDYVEEVPKPKDYEIPDLSEFAVTPDVPREDIADEVNEDVLEATEHKIIEAPIVFPEDEEVPEDIIEELVAPADHKVEIHIDFSGLEKEDAILEVKDEIPRPEGYVEEAPKPKEYEIPDLSEFARTPDVLTEVTADEANEDLLEPTLHKIIEAPIVFPEDEEVPEGIIEELVAPSDHKVEVQIDFSALEKEDAKLEIKDEIPRPEGYVEEVPKPKEYEIPDLSEFARTPDVLTEDTADEANEDLLEPTSHKIIEAPIVFPEDEEVLEEPLVPSEHKIVESPLDFSAFEEDEKAEVEVEIPKPEGYVEEAPKPKYYEIPTEISELVVTVDEPIEDTADVAGEDLLAPMTHVIIETPIVFPEDETLPKDDTSLAPIEQRVVVSPSDYSDMEELEGEAPKITIPLQDQEVEEGDFTFFDCRVSGRPKPKVYWFVDDQEVKEDAIYIAQIDLDGNCTLEIKDTVVEDEGLYVCQAVNPHGTATSRAQLFVRGMCVA